jgi:cytoskeletal protein RodZ
MTDMLENSADSQPEETVEEIPPVPELGTRLKTAREDLGLSLQEVAQRTRIRRVFLQAFENGDYEQLPATAYAIGFLRQYAALLGLDEERVVGDYRSVALPAGGVHRRHAEPDPARNDIPSPSKKSVFRGWLWLAVTVAILVALGLAYFMSGDRRAFSLNETPPSPAAELLSASANIDGKTTKTPKAPKLQDFVADDSEPVSLAGTPSQELETAPDATAAQISRGESERALRFSLSQGGSVLRLASKGLGWVEMEADGRPLQNYDMQPGTSLEWTINDFAKIRFDISGGVQAWLDNSEVSLPDAGTVYLGASGDDTAASAALDKAGAS